MGESPRGDDGGVAAYVGMDVFRWMMLVDTEADNHAALALFRSVGFGGDRPHVYLSRNLTSHAEYVRLRNERG